MASREPIRVLVTGAAGRNGLDDLNAVAKKLSAGQPVIVHWLGMESADEASNGAMKKLGDSAFPPLEGVVATTDVVEACTGVNIAVVDVGSSSEEGTEAKDFMPFYKSLALALGLHAAADCEIWAVGDPAIANELFLESSIPMKILARPDDNSAYSERLNVPANRVENANICGNRPSTPYPDTSFATVKTPNGEKSVHELPPDGARIDEEYIIKASERSSAMSAASSACDLIRDWVFGIYVKTLVSTGEDSVRKCLSAMSAASSARDHIRDWVIGTPEETLVSTGEDSDGKCSSAMSAVSSGWDHIRHCIIGTLEDGVPAGRNGTWSILEGLGTLTSAIFQSEDEGINRQMKELIEMIFNQLKELENRAGAALHHYPSIIDEFDRHADRAFENVCNMIEFLERETAKLAVEFRDCL